MDTSIGLKLFWDIKIKHFQGHYSDKQLDVFPTDTKYITKEIRINGEVSLKIN